jgi:hypothetical protein
MLPLTAQNSGMRRNDMEHLMQIGYNNVDHLSDLSMATVLFGLDVHTDLP